MLAEGNAQVDAEQASTGHLPIWRDVYNLMRCPGPPCRLGPHCWRDPIGKKHYKPNFLTLYMNPFMCISSAFSSYVCIDLLPTTNVN